MRWKWPSKPRFDAPRDVHETLTGHNRPYASVCFKDSKRDLQRDALVIARLGARYSFAAASSTVSTASGAASSRSLGIALPLLSDSP